MWSSYTFFNETNILEVRQLGGTAFNVIELSALEVLKHPGKVQLKSLEHLVGKLKDLRRHQDAAEYPESEHPIMSYSDNRQVWHLVRSLNVAPYRSFYMFEQHSFEGFNVVPPDTNKEIHNGQWYEHGALREWHERRRRKMCHPVSSFEDVPCPIDEYERENRAIRPSYLPQLEEEDITSGSESEPESSDDDQDKIASSAVGSTAETHHDLTNEAYLDADPSPRSTSHVREYASAKTRTSVSSIHDEIDDSHKCTTNDVNMLTENVSRTIEEYRPEPYANSNVHMSAANNRWKGNFTRLWDFSKWSLAIHGRMFTTPTTDGQYEEEDLD